MEAAGPYPYSEGFYFTGFDDSTGIGMWVAMHPTPYDWMLTREIIGFFMPDGRLLFSKGFGRNRTSKTQAAANLYFECQDPFQQWQIRYQGNVQVTEQAATLRSLVTDSHRYPCSFEFNVTGVTPTWMAGSRRAEGNVVHETLNEWHYNQLISFDGHLTFDGDRTALTGVGVRDRSRGSRNYGMASGHEFVFGLFPSMRAFGLYNMHTRDGGGFSEGYIVEDGVLHHAENVTVTRLTDYVPRGERIEIAFETDLGTTKIVGETLNCAGFTMQAPTEVLFGIDPDARDDLPFTESHTKWTWDSEVGYGLTERSNLPSA